MLTKPNLLHFERQIAKLALNYRPRPGPDSGPYVRVITNIRALQDSLDGSYGRVLWELALFRAAASILPKQHQEETAEALRAATEVCNNLTLYVDNAHLEASDAIQRVEAQYRHCIEIRRLALGMLAGLLWLLCGVGLGKLLATWLRS